MADRHLWGNAALAIANTLTTISHEVGLRADLDRAALLHARPDLARTLDDGHGGTITFAIRRTCCLLVRTNGCRQCGTCSVRARDERIDACAAYYRAERERLRSEGSDGAS